MTHSENSLLGSPLDVATRALVRLAAQVAGGTEGEIREALGDAVASTPPTWIEELILQTYLFAGFPRAPNAAREWRRLSGGSQAEAAEANPAGGNDDYTNAPEWRSRGEETCAVVYGDAYAPLRRNIAHLHPALDTWMIVEGYGKVLSRPGLDLPRRELCIIAACAHTGQDRQLHSHLHGALNAGAPAGAVDSTFDALEGILDHNAMRSSRMLWARVRTKHTSH
jgi:4-carboxymuconolactone decarboxylase